MAGFMVKFRILQITGSSSVGGTERMVLSLAQHLDKERFSVEVHSHTGVGILTKMALGSDIPATNGIFNLPFRRHYDLIHTYGFGADMLARLIPLFPGAKLICGVRSVDQGRSRMRVTLDRLSQSRVDLFISNSEAGRAVRISREGIAPEKIVTIHNGIELDPAEDESPLTRRLLGISEDAFPLIVHVANLRAMKGHGVALKALAELIQQYPEATTLFVGREDADGQYQEMAKALGLERNALFLNYHPSPRRIIRLADMAILPSQYEGCPVSILEAMAERKPVVASNVGGIPELISHEREGLLIPPENPHALATALIKLAADESLRLTMGEAGRRRVERDFTLEKMVSRYEETYRSLLGS